MLICFFRCCCCCCFCLLVNARHPENALKPRWRRRTTSVRNFLCNFSMEMPTWGFPWNHNSKSGKRFANPKCRYINPSAYESRWQELRLARCKRVSDRCDSAKDVHIYTRGFRMNSKARKRKNYKYLYIHEECAYVELGGNANKTFAFFSQLERRLNVAINNTSCESSISFLYLFTLFSFSLTFNLPLDYLSCSSIHSPRLFLCLFVDAWYYAIIFSRVGPLLNFNR